MHSDHRPDAPHCCSPSVATYRRPAPSARRKRTQTGLEALVGAAERHEKGGEEEAKVVPVQQPGDDKPMDPALLPEGEPEVEIESLIIPAVQGLHDKHIQAVAARNR